MRRQGRGEKLTQTQWEVDGSDEKWNQSRIDKTTVRVLQNKESSQCYQHQLLSYMKTSKQFDLELYFDIFVACACSDSTSLY